MNVGGKSLFMGLELSRGYLYTWWSSQATKSALTTNDLNHSSFAVSTDAAERTFQFEQPPRPLASSTVLAQDFHHPALTTYTAHKSHSEATNKLTVFFVF